MTSEEENGKSRIPNVTTTLVLGVVVLLIYVYWRTRRRKGMPPGPPALPLIGSLPFLASTDLCKAFQVAGQKYGNIFTVQIATRDVVVLNSYEVIKDALVNCGNIFSGRPSFMTGIVKGKGLISSEGPLWREQRKFAHGVLRDFGVGRTLLEDKIHEELESLLKYLAEQAIDKPFNPSHILHNAVSNMICSIVFGKRYEYDDPKFKFLLEIMNNLIARGGLSTLVLNYPLVQYLPGDFFGLKYRKRIQSNLFKIFQDDIEEHKSSRSPGLVWDYIDTFLQQKDKEIMKQDSTFQDDQLIASIASLFNAGTETTATTLKWLILFLLHNPAIETKVYEEINQALGERMPSMKDKINLPYTEAVILESLRLGDLVPQSIPHRTTEDVNFRGYFIPKDTTVVVNLHGTLYDPLLWKDPFKFNPTRFLDSDGNVEKNEHLIPFSMGKRVCLGESMARMELFLFFTGIMQRFSFKLPPGQTLPDTYGSGELIHTPPSFEIMLVPRT